MWWYHYVGSIRVTIGLMPRKQWLCTSPSPWELGTARPCSPSISELSGYFIQGNKTLKFWTFKTDWIESSKLWHPWCCHTPSKNCSCHAKSLELEGFQTFIKPIAPVQSLAACCISCRIVLNLSNCTELPEGGESSSPAWSNQWKETESCAWIVRCRVNFTFLNPTETEWNTTAQQ